MPMVSPAENDPSLRDLVKVLVRRRTIILATIAVCLGVAILLSIVKTRRYQATSMVELQPTMRDSIGLSSATPAASTSGPEPLSVNLELQTQSNILQSEQIALNVIRDLHLENTADFREHFSPIGFVLGIFSPKGSQDRPGASIEDSPQRRRRLVETFEKNLQVKVVAGTRLIEISYSNPDPGIAAGVANDMVKQIIDYNYQVRFKAANDASKSLQSELTGLRDRNNELQSRVVALQKDTGLFGTGSTDAEGKPAIYNPILARLQVATETLAQAQSNRILKQAVYQTITSGNADLVSQLSGTAVTGASQGVMNSLNLIQTLRAQEASLQAQIEQQSVKFGPAYPPLTEARASLARIQSSLREEVERIRARAENDLEIAKRAESEDQAAYDAIKSQAEKLNDRTIDFTSLEREATQSQNLYQDFLRRLSEAGIVDSLPSASIAVVNQARPPSKPSSPNVPLYLAIALALGCFLGVSGAFLIDSLDGRVFAVEDIKNRNMTLLGVLPRVEKPEMSETVPMVSLPQSLFSESMLMVRSALFASGKLQDPAVILVTSSGRGEGKSSVAVNLAAALGYNAKRVLLIEADLRRPNLHSRLNEKSSIGLNQLQTSAGTTSQQTSLSLKQVLSHMDQQSRPFPALPGTDSVWVLPAGSISENPAELLGSPGFRELIARLKEQFDYIVVDTPPALLVADAQLVAPIADYLLLVARFGVTPNEALQRASTLLSPHVKSSNIGVVLNGVPTGREYYGYQLADVSDQTIDGRIKDGTLAIAEKIR